MSLPGTLSTALTPCPGGCDTLVVMAQYSGKSLAQPFTPAPKGVKGNVLIGFSSAGARATRANGRGDWMEHFCRGLMPAAAAYKGRADIVLVPSSSTTTVYLVAYFGDDSWWCSCPAGQRGLACKHLDKAKVVLQQRREGLTVLEGGAR